MSVLFLRGQEHVGFGAVGEAAAEDVAVAISRGGAPKPYDHTDPNEDAALAMRGRHGALVAVADGHFGHRGAECALEALMGSARDWLECPPRGADAWYQLALAALVEANAAVLAAPGRARTTLSFALARPADDLLLHGALGDSHLFVVDSIVASEIPRPERTLFLGTGALAPSAAERHGRIGVQALDRPRAIVAATDGLSERAIGVADPAGAVHAAVAGAAGAPADRRAGAAARAIVDAALAAHRAQGAGDNVAAAVAWLA